MARPANTNKRVFYATHAVAIGDKDASAVVDSWKSGDTALDGTGKLMIIHGLQSCGITSNFNLDNIFELGQLSAYEIAEGIPEVEVSCEKVLDGYTLLYHAGTVGATNPTLVGRANARADIRLLVARDTDPAVNENTVGIAEIYVSGAYLSSLSYNLNADGSNFTESVNFVCNNKLALAGADTGGLLADDNGVVNPALSGVFGDDSPGSPHGHVLKRQNLVDGSTGMTHNGVTFRTVVPDILDGATTGAVGIAGPTSSGLMTNCSYVDPMNDGIVLNGATINATINREEIPALGKRGPYFRFASFPVEVTCELNVTARSVDNVDVYEEEYNLKNHSIQFVLDDSTVISLGNRNKLTSVNFEGGDTGGGNRTMTFSFSNQNDLVVLHSGDPAAINASDYWKDHFA